MSMVQNFRVHGLDPPNVPVRLELDEWTYGPVDARDRVTGNLEDFCRVVTKRRHREETRLVASSPLAEQWLRIAQASPPALPSVCTRCRERGVAPDTSPPVDVARAIDVDLAQGPSAWNN
jgi:hypothetical protein